MADETASLDKIANVLALLLTKDMTKSASAATLSSAGFSTRDIASLIGTSENSVRALMSQSKKKPEK